MLLADILSCLAMTAGKEPNESLKFKLLGHGDDLASWGHEYVRSLAGEIGAEWQSRAEAEPPASVDNLRVLVAQIIPFDMAHNAEVEVSGPRRIFLEILVCGVAIHFRTVLYGLIG